MKEEFEGQIYIAMPYMVIFPLGLCYGFPKFSDDFIPFFDFEKP